MEKKETMTDEQVAKLLESALEWNEDHPSKPQVDFYSMDHTPMNNRPDYYYKG